jgi:hypothetical protein
MGGLGAAGSGLAGGMSSIGGIGAKLGSGLMGMGGEAISGLTSQGIGTKMGIDGLMGKVVNAGGNLAQARMQQRLGLHDKWNGIMNKDLGSGNIGQEYLDTLLKIAIGR